MIDDGIFLIKDLKYDFLMDNIGKIFDKLKLPQNQKSITNLNEAYFQNLVFKDATGSQMNGINQKRTWSLSSNEISIVNKKNPSLVPWIGAELNSALCFIDRICNQVAPLILSAICKAVQIDVDAEKINFNCCMLDYYGSANALVQKCGAKCGEHRDFGLFTLIFQDSTGGLQIQRCDGKWYDIEADEHSVVCLFGWCAQILSNDRIKATKHRIVGSGDRKRRKSVVLFVAPENDQILRPFVLKGEKGHHCSAHVGRLIEEMEVD